MPAPPTSVAVPAAESWRVLVVESNEQDAQALACNLRRYGHETHVVTTGAAALRSHHCAEVILLGCDLPDADALEVCRSVRATSNAPLLALNSVDSELDRVLGLQAGADDYLVKPYGFRELLARIGAVMRRVPVDRRSACPTAPGPLHVEPSTREVRLQGKPIPVTRKEFDLLRLLADAPGSVITRQQILRHVWQDTEDSRSRTVDTHVNSLRRKLGDPGWIITVRGVGFRLGQV
ncbi:response regulator transcription factor [Kitasatospora sp. NPDC094011]|uniref:response regulator transcription factor n=1 Tax=Kitasatospora sp. NPDC094011 TaxID=3364090 RepID=UPI003808E62F